MTLKPKATPSTPSAPSAPSEPSDRPLEMVKVWAINSNTGAEEINEIPLARYTQMQLNVARQQAQTRMCLEQMMFPPSNNDSQYIAPIHAATNQPTVANKDQDVQATSAARVADSTVSKLERQEVQLASLPETKPSSVGSRFPATSNLILGPVEPVIVEDLKKRVCSLEKHLHAEKQMTATLEEALVDLEQQSNKFRADKDACQRKLQSLEKEHAQLSGRLDSAATRQEERHSTSGLPAGQGQNPKEPVSVVAATDHQGEPDLVAMKACEVCRQRQASCTRAKDQVACTSCASSNSICSYLGPPPPSSSQDAPISSACFSVSPSDPKKTTHTHIVPAAHGHAFEVRAGSRFRIIDLHGEQVVDFMAWCTPFKPKSSSSESASTNEHLSMSYTRHAIGGSAPPQIGECLYSNRDEPMFQLVADTVKTHDMLYMACNPGFYKRLGKEGHRSCATNVAEAMAKWGMESWLEVVDPFNVFQNTPYYTLKALNCSQAGDYVELKALKDVVCAVSSCPYDGDGFNGGNVTEIAVVTGI